MHESNDPDGPRKDLMASSGSRLAFVALIVANICLATGPLFVRQSIADGGIGPIAVGLWRLALAAPFLLLLTRTQRQPIGRMPASLWAMIALAGVFFAADLASWHAGIQHTKLANATLFGNFASLIFPIYGFVIARALPSRMQALALALAAVGVVLLLGRSYELSRQNLVGDLLCLLAGLLYTGYLIAIDRARARLMAWPLLTISTIAGIAPLLFFAWIAGESIIPHSWTALVILALVSQVMGQGLMIYAMGTMRPLIVGLALLSQPVVAALIGWALYAERLGALDIVGAVAIGVALVLVRQTPARGTAASA